MGGVVLIEFRLLGPVEAYLDGRRLDLGHARQRSALVALLLDANTVVSADQLLDRIWGERAPAGAAATLYSYLSRLRRALADIAGVKLARRSGGYLLTVDTAAVDVHRFRSLLAQGHATGGEQEAAALLEHALQLWRGEPFTGLDSAWINGVRDRLEADRLAAELDLTDIQLRRGNHTRLLAQLAARVEAHPLHERLTGQLILALYRSGRQADALDTYEHLRQRLADDLGADPGPQLRQLHRQILSADPALAPPTTPEQRSSEVPRQLPAPPQAFTGRSGELADIDQVHDASTVVICAIDGMAGVGKTALAVHAAHRIADRYPDGQLFIDLHGYTHGVEPIEPAEALDRMLRALGVLGPQIPASLDERAALYRTRLADRQMLILLDNAATEAQVQPLLPGSPGCLMLITSRRRLAGLDHTTTLSLDALPLSDAGTLFTRTVGECRLTDQPPDLLLDLIKLCGRLPLAIRIAAARLRSHSAWSLSQLVERLRDQRARLDELEAGNRSVAAALDLSYQHLSRDQQRCYRLLGVHPGPDIDLYATAALLDSTPIHAARMLDQLLDAHLLQEPAAGRFRFHDLTRAHAAAHGHAEPAAYAALGRLLDHYRHIASLAMDAAYPYEQVRRPRVPPADTPGPDLPDPAAALNWLDTELPNLLATARYATEHGNTELVLHLSVILHRYLRSRGRYHDAETLHQQALATACTTGDQEAQLTAQVSLGELHRLQGRHTQAANHYRQALQIAQAIGHRFAETEALNGLGYVGRLQGRHTQAANHLRQALQIAQAIGHRFAEMDALSGLGYIHQLQGRHTLAADHHRRALQIARSIGHRFAEVDALIGLGHIYWRQGRYARAADHFGQVLQIARSIGHRSAEMHVLTGLGHVHRRQDRYGQAADHYRQALHIARSIGHRRGEMNALTGLGYIHRRQGQYEQASDQYQRLLDLAQESGSRNSQFEAWQGLGRLQHATGHPDTALTHHEQALALATELNQPDDQARAHDGVARAHHALNHHQQARSHWQQALDILTSLGVDHTDEEETTIAAIRAHLACPDPAG